MKVIKEMVSQLDTNYSKKLKSMEDMQNATSGTVGLAEVGCFA